MVGGPVFGPSNKIEKAAVFVVALAIALVLLWGVFGCSTHSYLYRPAPSYLIPQKPDLPAVKARELQCLSDDVYVRLATRDRLQQQYADELRALLSFGDK